ncbi:hypothetical protein DPX16_6464 [Anabarilius grahami]|uniref:Uncharacterized protein n=2 Tax=Xenocypridinae TaxID=2743747 RepID=A0A3N0YM89_ANAGA|nr:hypothetical protein DPX16_6464 [Anabarilius grahami]
MEDKSSKSGKASSVSSKSTSSRSSASDAAARARVSFAERELAMKKEIARLEAEKATLEATLEALQAEKEAAATQAEAKILEAAAEVGEYHDSKSSSDTPLTVQERTNEYVKDQRGGPPPQGGIPQSSSGSRRSSEEKGLETTKATSGLAELQREVILLQKRKAELEISKIEMEKENLNMQNIVLQYKINKLAQDGLITLQPVGEEAALWSCPVEDRIHHAGMDGLLRNCATGCRVDEAFTMDDLVDSISADTSGLRCGHVQLRIVFITPLMCGWRECAMACWIYIATVTKGGGAVDLSRDRAGHCRLGWCYNRGYARDVIVDRYDCG